MGARVRLFLLGSMLAISGCPSHSTDDSDPSPRGRCEDLCATFADCLSPAVDVAECLTACVSDARNATDRCVDGFEAYADCLSINGLDCGDAFNGACENVAENFLDDCDADFATTFGLVDGAGCVGADCCPFAFDGECDEPEGTGLCADGTDTTDCS
jgi:hypothetical protein